MRRGTKRERAVTSISAAVVLACGAMACSGADEAGSDGDPSGGGVTPESAVVNATDGVKSGDETDVDCGGSSPNRCAVGKSCVVGGDCASASCRAGKCAEPAPDDGIANGDETDVDCGGAKAPKCDVDKACASNADCAAGACSYAKKCVAYPSCVGHHGGDTCGDGETGKGGAAHESCCTTIAIGDRQAGAFKIDKYLLTAGRMRAIVEATKGDLQGFITKAKPEWWNNAWTAALPKNMGEALFLLGPSKKRGCNVKFDGGRTYWQPAIDGDAAEKSDFSQDVLDEKALNCVTWQMAAAACAFDGKRLAKADEIRHVFENRGRQGGATTYPWQFADTTPYDPTMQDPRVVHRWSYATPDPPATMRLVPNGGNPYPLDKAFYVAPPGRRKAGANMHGVQDAAGNLMPWVLEGAKQFVRTLSWEKHAKNMTPATWNQTDASDAYYAIGARCASD